MFSPTYVKLIPFSREVMVMEAAQKLFPRRLTWRRGCRRDCATLRLLNIIGGPLLLNPGGCRLDSGIGVLYQRTKPHDHLHRKERDTEEIHLQVFLKLCHFLNSCPKGVDHEKRQICKAISRSIRWDCLFLRTTFCSSTWDALFKNKMLVLANMHTETKKSWQRLKNSIDKFGQSKTSSESAHA